MNNTKVVITAVGPYSKCGSNLIALCAAYGTDYCDTTGEVKYFFKIIIFWVVELRNYNDFL